MAEFACRTGSWWHSHRRRLRERARREAGLRLIDLIAVAHRARPVTTSPIDGGRGPGCRRPRSLERDAAAPPSSSPAASPSVSQGSSRSTAWTSRSAAGEIVALLGPNGAGKSTFIQVRRRASMPTGSYEGAMALDGARLPAGERRGRRARRGRAHPAGGERRPRHDRRPEHVPQRRADALRPHRLAGAVRGRRRASCATSAWTSPATERMGSLDLATQQLVVIARALAKRARLLILDEPTAALTEGETQRLFEQLRALRARGVAIVFVSHRLSEVFAIADRILVMRDGRLTGDHRRRRRLPRRRHRGDGRRDGPAACGATRHPGAPVLEVAGLTVTRPAARATRAACRTRLDWSSEPARSWASSASSGQAARRSSRASSAPGRARPRRPRPARLRRISPRRCRRRPSRCGLGLMSQDRRESLVARPRRSPTTSSSRASTIVSRVGFLDVERKRAIAARASAWRCASAPHRSTRPCARSSGGNQQKVQVARWLVGRARACCCSTIPRAASTWGRVPRSTRSSRDLAAAGCGLLWVSSDAEELVDVADRILDHAPRPHRGRGHAPPRQARSRLLAEAAGV